jgi:hypothetical protein
MFLKKKIYFAGISCIKRTKVLLDSGFKYFMCSYANKPSRNVINLIKSYEGTELMLDSGAFTVWKQGETIDIYQYINFIKNNDIDVYFNLDVIGDVEGTKKNQKIMGDNGLNPIPVFHYGEPFEYLDWLVKQGYEYIGLRGTVGKTVQQRKEFFDEVFRRHPDIDYHALGVGAKGLVEGYSWFSVDSTTWLTPFKNKAILTNEGKSRKSDIQDSYERFYISLEYFKYLNNLDRK